MNESGRNRLEGYFQAKESTINNSEVQASDVLHPSGIDQSPFDAEMINDFFDHLFAELRFQYEYSAAYERGLKNGVWDVPEEDMCSEHTADELADHQCKRDIWLLPHIRFNEVNATEEEAQKAGAAAYGALKEMARRKLAALEELRSTIKSAVLCIESGEVDEDGCRLQHTAPFSVRTFIDEVSQTPEDILRYTTKIVNLGSLGKMGAD